MGQLEALQSQYAENSFSNNNDQSTSSLCMNHQKSQTWVHRLVLLLFSSLCRLHCISSVMKIKAEESVAEDFWELFLVNLTAVQWWLTTQPHILVTVVRKRRMQTFFLPNEEKGRWDCSLSGRDEEGFCCGLNPCDSRRAKSSGRGELYLSFDLWIMSMSPLTFFLFLLADFAKMRTNVIIFPKSDWFKLQ